MLTSADVNALKNRLVDTASQPMVSPKGLCIHWVQSHATMQP